MPLSRRQFIQTASLAFCTGGLPLRGQASGQTTPLPIPPLLESKRGQPFFLTLQKAHWTFINGRKAGVWGINGFYLGPTVRVRRGDDVKLIYRNQLPESVAMEVSGLQVPGPLYGGGARLISSNMGWAPVLPIRQAAATLWYHANTPGHMAEHVYNGLVGMWLIEDENSKNLPLPNHYGVDDFPVILQDKLLNNHGQPQYDPSLSTGFYGNTLLVNGVEQPIAEVSRGWIRLRLLNASNARRYRLTLTDGRPFYLIANDQGLIANPVASQTLTLAPGERREVLIDMSKGESVSISAGEAAGVLDRLRGLFSPSMSLVTTTVLTLQPSGLLPLLTEHLPSALPAESVSEGNVVNTRTLRLGDASQEGINGAIWDPNRIDIRAQQGTWERWQILADTPQAFYLQGAKFLVKSVNNAPPLAEDRGWKDTVWVDGEVSLFVYFPQPSSEHFPFTYYSQTLEFADRGTAGRLWVQPAALPR